MDARGPKTEVHGRGEPVVREARPYAVGLHAGDDPFQAPGKQGGLASIAHAEERRAVPERAARIDEPKLAASGHGVGEPGGGGADRHDGEHREQDSQREEDASHWAFSTGASVTSAS